MKRSVNFRRRTRMSDVIATFEKFGVAPPSGIVIPPIGSHPELTQAVNEPRPERCEHGVWPLRFCTKCHSGRNES